MLKQIKRKNVFEEIKEILLNSFMRKLFMVKFFEKYKRYKIEIIHQPPKKQQQSDRNN